MIKYHIVIDIVGLEFDHLQSGIVPNISRIANEGESAKMVPVFPAVTNTIQATLLSGTYPSEHGIIGNGLYDRINHNISFWNNPLIWSRPKESGTSQRKIEASEPCPTRFRDHP